MTVTANRTFAGPVTIPTSTIHITSITAAQRRKRERQADVSNAVTDARCSWRSPETLGAHSGTPPGPEELHRIQHERLGAGQLGVPT
jgi:hypothetical protein